MALEYLGVDVALNTTAGDIYPLPAGDVYTSGGTELVLQDVWLRLVTPKGDLWCHEEYGVDIYEYLHAENTMTNRMDLCAMIRAEVRKDPRVEPESVEAVVQSWNQEREEIAVNVSFVVEGQANRQNLVIGYDLQSFGALALRGDERW